MKKKRFNPINFIPNQSNIKEVFLMNLLKKN